MPLDEYRRKRNFKQTLEPDSAAPNPSGKLVFVVQRHQARRLHYDFRLEMDGVLKSWAIPKGPSMNPAHKRLAMRVEDHPYDYKDFKGVIPPGNYGAGIVEIWDRGTYGGIGDSASGTEPKLLKQLDSGDLKITLHGKKLKGEFTLVKPKNSNNEAWLLIKHNDRYAVHGEYDSEAQTPASSAINKLLKQRRNSKNNHPQPEPASRKKFEDAIPPMLTKETGKAFDDKDWLFEIKWDGYRAIAELNRKDVRLYSRNANPFNQTYPEIVEALAQMNLNAVIDGEIVVTNENGLPHFQLLQHYGEDRSYPIHYYVFDLLSLDGESLLQLPLIERKQKLRDLIPKDGIVKYSDHIEEKGKAMFALARDKKLEGIMAKQARSEYLPGQRTANWLKIKHRQTVDAIICGFTAPAGERKFFGALVLGAMQQSELIYIGHSGSGFNNSSLEESYNKLKPLITDRSPFKAKITTNAPVSWVKPELACEVKISGITCDGRLRHPIFLRIRDDKSAEEITLPQTGTVTKKQAESESGAEKSGSVIALGRHKVAVSHRDKVFWPGENITKGGMIDYYSSISDLILPYLKDRPQSLKRNPGGITDAGFYHKDAGEDVPAYVQTLSIYSESTRRDIDYILCNNAATLAYLNNLGCIELNPWHSTVQALDYPDYLVIDIDPSENNTFDQAIEVANAVHDVLERAGAANFCKTSGATGLHVYVPTRGKYGYDQIKVFAELICTLVHEQLPEFTSMERNLAERGNNIYLDYLQNRKGQTICAVYSLRPRPGAPVSMPLKWEEVRPGLSPAQFNIHSAAGRIKKTGDLFKGVLGKGIDMKACLKKLG